MILIKSFNYHLKIKNEGERKERREDREGSRGGSQEVNLRAGELCGKISIPLKILYFLGLTITHIRA